MSVSPRRPTAPSLPSTRRRLMAAVAGSAAAALVVTAAGGGSVVPASAQTVSPHVLINEVYGGGGNRGAAFQNDFVELRNTGSEPVQLDGWSLQYASRGGSAFNNSMPLSGTIAPGSTFLIQLASGSGHGAPLPAADLTGSINVSGTGGTFALVTSTDHLVCEATACQDAPTVLDLLGWGGAVTFSGSAPAPKTANAVSVSRTANTGQNATDFVAGDPTPQASAAEPAPEPTADPTSEPTPDPTPGPTGPVSIEEIQGTGDASPLVGQTVTTRGVVTAVYATGGLNGFVIQTGGTGGSMPERSPGLFVYAPEGVNSVSMGDSVEVRGTVSEFYGQTQLTLNGAPVQLPEALPAVTPLKLSEVPSGSDERERLENVLLDLSGATYTVTDVYQAATHGEIALVAGDAPLRQPGDVMAPGPEATAQFEANEAKKLILDDGKTTNFSRHTDEQISYITLEEPVRVGARAMLEEPVVLQYGHNQWRLQPRTPWSSARSDGVAFENTRLSSPKDVGGDVQIATFNVLNYFPTLGEDVNGCTPYRDRDGAPISVRKGCIVRGAFTKDSFERQQTKIVEAINATGAEVVGLMEIENSARVTGVPDQATATLVKALNAQEGKDTWDYVRTGPAFAAQGDTGGHDAITSAIIYKKSLVRPEADAQVLANSPAFINAREPIGQVFVPLGKASDGSLAEGEPFFFVVNHFKSKGSADAYDASLPADPVQGNARTSRQLQADALLAWTKERSAALGVSDVYLGGDFNAYTQEVPLQTMYDAGYTDLVSEHSPGEWSYSYGGMVGSLDHLLANSSAKTRVTGATDWSINGPESVMLQYSRYNSTASTLYEDGVFASSDHNPLIVGVDAKFPANPTPDPTPNPTPDPPVDPTPEPTGEPTDEPTTPGHPGTTGDPGTPSQPGTGENGGGTDSPGRGTAQAGKPSAGGSLPRTGAEIAPYALGALALLMGGGVILLARRSSGR